MFPIKNTKATYLTISLLTMMILLHTCEGAPDLTITEGQCGATTTLTCISPLIQEGDRYIWYKKLNPRLTIYDNTHNGMVGGDKYNGTSRNGMLVLDILNGNDGDSGVYQCHHNFSDSNTVELAISCAPDLTITEGQCGATTTLTCISPLIQEGDRYIWYKKLNPRLTIYDNTHNGMVGGDKYNGTSRNGMLVLDILNGNDGDSGVYQCHHNFSDSNTVELAISCTLDLTITVGQCGATSTLTCTNPLIEEGDEYIWYKLNPKSTIYDNTHNGLVVIDRYNGTSRDGILVLEISNTSDDDSGTYQCSHNFVESNIAELAISCETSSGSTSKNAGDRVNINNLIIFIVIVWHVGVNVLS